MSAVGDSTTQHLRIGSYRDLINKKGPPAKAAHNGKPRWLKYFLDHAVNQSHRVIGSFTSRIREGGGLVGQTHLLRCQNDCAAAGDHLHQIRSSRYAGPMPLHRKPPLE